MTMGRPAKTITHKGSSKTAKEWAQTEQCQRLKLTAQLITNRISRGWPPERTLTEPQNTMQQASQKSRRNGHPWLTWNKQGYENHRATHQQDDQRNDQSHGGGSGNGND